MNTQDIQENAELALSGIENNWPVTMLEGLLEIAYAVLRETASFVDRDEMQQLAADLKADKEVSKDRDYLAELRENLVLLIAECKKAEGLDPVTCHLMLDDIIEKIRECRDGLIWSRKHIRNIAAIVAKRDLIEIMLDAADENGF